VLLDYLGHGQVSLNVRINRGDPELVKALKPLQALLVARAKAAVSHIADS
jgi:hypothetical protein